MRAFGSFCGHGNVLFKDVCTNEEATTDDDSPPEPPTKGAFRRAPPMR
jgi:hypothetical protein